MTASDADRALERAYRDGRVDAKLDDHSAHLLAINGSQERTSATLVQLAASIEKIRDQLADVVGALPRLQTFAEQVAHAQVIDTALKQKRDDDRTFWDRNRVLVAWALGIVAVVTATASTWLHLLGVG